MTSQRIGIGVVAVAWIAATIAVGVGTTGNAPPWLEALNARSDALNREHGLGDYGVRRVLGQPAPNWLEALRARSEAMNRYYGLGAYARQGAHRTGAPDWLVALNARSEALNRQYELGEYAARAKRAAAHGAVRNLPGMKRQRDAARVARVLTQGPYATTSSGFNAAGVPANVAKP